MDRATNLLAYCRPSYFSALSQIYAGDLNQQAFYLRVDQSNASYQLNLSQTAERAKTG